MLRHATRAAFELLLSKLTAGELAKLSINKGPDSFGYDGPLLLYRVQLSLATMKFFLYRIWSPFSLSPLILAHSVLPRKADSCHNLNS
jgi:hypothetical protein